MEFDYYSPSETFVVLNDDQFVGRDDGLLEQQKQDSHVCGRNGFLSDRRSGADTVVNVATIEFRFRAIVLIEKIVLDVVYEKVWRSWVPCLCPWPHH